MTADEWLQEAMRQINSLTPDVAGKAFNTDWFLLRNHLENGVRVLLSDAISAEREECATVCETLDDGKIGGWYECASAIRARSNVQIEGLAATKRERSPKSSKNHRPQRERLSASPSRMQS